MVRSDELDAIADKRQGEYKGRPSPKTPQKTVPVARTRAVPERERMSSKSILVKRTRGDQEQDTKFLKELAVDRNFFQVKKILFTAC
jgi:hypothetical protein